MIVVAVIITLILGFSPAATSILPPDSNMKLKFMLATLGITCTTQAENKSPQATHLLILISSQDEDYISQVHNFLKAPTMIHEAKYKNYKLVEHARTDEHFKLLHQYARSKQKWADSLQESLNTDDKWIGYTVEANDPGNNTFVPVPTLLERNHSTRIFAVITDRPSGPEVASAGPLLQCSAIQPRDQGNGGCLSLSSTPTTNGIRIRSGAR